MAGSTRRLLICGSICALPFALCPLPGCAGNGQPSTQPTTPQERQEAALRDPMGYKPPHNGDISGGDITSFDKDAFKRDVNDVLNP
jgi:hypothetical protein